MPKKQLTGV